MELFKDEPKAKHKHLTCQSYPFCQVCQDKIGYAIASGVRSAQLVQYKERNKTK